MLEVRLLNVLPAKSQNQEHYLQWNFKRPIFLHSVKHDTKFRYKSYRDCRLLGKCIAFISNLQQTGSVRNQDKRQTESMQIPDLHPSSLRAVYVAAMELQGMIKHSPMTVEVIPRICSCASQVNHFPGKPVPTFNNSFGE